MAGVPEILISDSDILDESNLGRIPLRQTDVTRRKNQSIQEVIRNIRPSCHVIRYNNLRNTDAFPLYGECDLIVATTDSWASRKLAKQLADRNGCRYLEASAEGEMAGVASSPADFATEEEENPGYASVPVWAGSSVLAATLLVYHALHPNNLTSIRAGWQDGKMSWFEERPASRPKVKVATPDEEVAF
jgi:hypothetical protein